MRREVAKSEWLCILVRVKKYSRLIIPFLSALLRVHPPSNTRFPWQRPARPRRLRAASLLLGLAAALAQGKGTGERRDSPPPDPTRDPRATLAAFDSLLQAGAFAEAEALCTGEARRMFGFLVQAQRQVQPFVDTARSRDSVLAEALAEPWAAVKVASHVVFLRPLMGMRDMRSLQAVHLYREDGVWKLAAFEELAHPDSPLVLRRGKPARVDSAQAAEGPWFPVSSRAPEQACDRMVLNVKWRDGEGAGSLPLTGSQRVLSGNAREGWRVESRLIEIPSRVPSPPGKKPSAPDSRYLAATDWLILSDTLLRAKADSLGAGRSSQERAARIHAYLGEHFRFALGAALFNDSRSVLRDMRGDCSEASVLSAALLRAAGIPTRILLGFATLGKGVFIGHAWNEVYLEGRWIGFDAALREFPARPGRLALLVSDGSGDMRIAATNLMLKAMSNLDLEIVEASQGGKKVPLRAMDGNIRESMDFFRQMLEGMGKDGGR